MDYSLIESPGLIVFPEIVKSNIKLAINMVSGNLARLRPHIKTHKTQEVNELLLEAGIFKFKCATIAEAELLAISKAKDILLSIQPTGTTLERFIQLVKFYPNSQFSCLVDDYSAAQEINDLAEKNQLNIHIFIDVNVGMNRTGIISSHANPFIVKIKNNLKNLFIKGLHAYDGHIRDFDLTTRVAHVQKDFIDFYSLIDQIDKENEYELVVGGTPSFLVHRTNNRFVCSPGTFVFFDMGYSQLFPENTFEMAVQIISRVISKPTHTTICIDLGHKAVASENPIENRVRFLDFPLWSLKSQSEEHGIIEVGDNSEISIGQIVRMYPYHICPTVALHQNLQVVESNQVKGEWIVKARNRKINI
jgi:D-serine deaminase-like pyridoxal phosphate-dependent protein